MSHVIVSIGLTCLFFEIMDRSTISIFRLKTSADLLNF
jgi:hypothetical protein